MIKIVAAKVLDGYRVWLRFEDGAEGEVDFSTQVGKGVFAPWTDYEFFRDAAIGEQGRVLTWPGELDFLRRCPLASGHRQAARRFVP